MIGAKLDSTLFSLSPIKVLSNYPANQISDALPRSEMLYIDRYPKILAIMNSLPNPIILLSRGIVQYAVYNAVYMYMINDNYVLSEN